MLVTTLGDIVVSQHSGGTPITGRQRPYPPRLEIYNGMMHGNMGDIGDWSTYVPSLTNLISAAILFGGGYFFCRYRAKKGKNV